ncbi:MAG TPA: hypothetical protein VM869_19910 [Enhygromyxa sp.]|nr:hypothetical protein [Enhygromyxa sp.]
MNTAQVVAPLIAVGISFSCTNSNDPDPIGNSDVRVSAAVQADIDGLAGVSVKLTPALDCGIAPEKLDNDGTPYSFDLDITQIPYPDGSAFGAATDYTHLMGEAAFESVVPGCYDVIAAPTGPDGEPLESCHSTTIPIVVDDYTSLIVDIPLQCGDVSREQLDVIDGNFAPHIDMLTAEPMVSACDVTQVCVTARDADYDMLEFEWPQPEGIEGRSPTAPWPTIIRHTYNADRSVTQCIAVQARDSGSYEIGVNVYDLARGEPGTKPARIEDVTGAESHASDALTLDATLGCEATGRSAVILLTLDNDPGMPRDAARTLIDNTVAWVGHGDATHGTSVLVVRDDNHHGEDALDGEYVTDLMVDLGYDAKYIEESPDGLVFSELMNYDVVWFVNPGHEMDDPISHTALLRYRASGGGLVLQGDDIARFYGNPSFMEPLTYLVWGGNGTTTCGVPTDNNAGESFEVAFEIPTANPHPMAAGLELLSFPYGNDIDHTRPLGKGERVLAWASLKTDTCEVRTPAVVALEPDDLLAWE